MTIRDFICLMCPNGCRLTTQVKDAGPVEVSGNNCDKGLAFARGVLAHEGLSTNGRIVSGGTRPSYSSETLREIVALWGLSVKVFHKHLTPEGSPERTVFRTVFEDKQGGLFTLEQISPASYHAKMRIIKTLEFLDDKKMPKIVPYRPGTDGQYIHRHGEELWQLVPFIPGVPLDRERYLYEGWRAKVLAHFLIDLKTHSQGLTFFALDKPFSIKEYIYMLLHQIEHHNSDIAPRVRKIVTFLERAFMPVHDEIPVRFCHGDFHPLNIIWGRSDVNAVIDWEFLGMKPEIYDLSNMLGCLGIEHPSSLVGDLGVGLVLELKKAEAFTPQSWEHLTDFVLAMRFAWLSEWLRKKDTEMITLELDYMELLMGGRDDLRRAWGLK